MARLIEEKSRLQRKIIRITANSAEQEMWGAGGQKRENTERNIFHQEI